MVLVMDNPKKGAEADIGRTLMPKMTDDHEWM